MRNLDLIIKESIENYINENVITEGKKEKGKKEKGWRKKAIKAKGGSRKDYNVDDERTYNQNADDLEQSSVKDFLKSGFINIKKVAEKLYPDHTPEGAQSQLRKKLEGEKSDSGSEYKLKRKDIRRLRQIIANIKN